FRRYVAKIEPEPGLSLVGIRTVAGEAFVGKYRANVAIERQLRLRGRSYGGNQTGDKDRGAHKRHNVSFQRGTSCHWECLSFYHATAEMAGPRAAYWDASRVGGLLRARKPLATKTSESPRMRLKTFSVRSVREISRTLTACNFPS